MEIFDEIAAEAGYTGRTRSPRPSGSSPSLITSNFGFATCNPPRYFFAFPRTISRIPG